MSNTMNALCAYQHAVNKIDDYFEYRYACVNQEENKKFVREILEELTKELVDSGNK